MSQAIGPYAGLNGRTGCETDRALDWPERGEIPGAIAESAGDDTIVQ